MKAEPLEGERNFAGLVSILGTEGAFPFCIGCEHEVTPPFLSRKNPIPLLRQQKSIKETLREGPKSPDFLGGGTVQERPRDLEASFSSA